MTTNPETLTQIVADALEDGLTYRALEDNSIDPQTGYRPAKSTLWKVSKGHSVQLSPELVRAIAKGLGIEPLRAARAAAVQYAGYIPEDVAGGTVVRESGAPASDLAAERNLIKLWDDEDSERNHPGK